MPGLSFYPQYERHLSYVAMGHCPRHYQYVTEIRDGKRSETPLRGSLIVGIGMDVGVGHWWVTGNIEEALARAEKAVTAENAVPGTKVPLLVQEVLMGVRQYVEQWDDVRDWRAQGLVVHPYEASILALLIYDGTPWTLETIKEALPSAGAARPYLCMPDLVLGEDGEGPLTIVDFKTGKYPYDPLQWAYDPQLLTYCLNKQQHYPTREIQFLIDYMQRPHRKGGWTFPITYPFPFTPARRKVAEDWMALNRERIQYYNAEGAFPRDPSACRTWYGRCAHYATCFGETENGS